MSDNRLCHTDVKTLGQAMGIVVIGRNEGSRLERCLESLQDFEGPILYADSNSTDESVACATAWGVTVLELDPSKPLSAARARREGFRQLTSRHTNIELVFFVDGDCQIAPQWLEIANRFLGDHQEVAAICGRRREQYLEHSVYNRLCDNEWDTPIGAAQSVGGDAVYRCQAYRDAGEFNASVPAGEEPELCKRLRDSGWKLWRIDAEMTIHDAAMSHFRQWWRRQLRTGYAGFDVERRFRIRVFDRILKSACFWAILMPLASLLAALALGWFVSTTWAAGCLAVAMLAVLLQSLRIVWRTKRRNTTWAHSLEFGFFLMAAKLPIALGVIKQLLETARGKPSQLIEYKTADSLRMQS